MTDFASRYQKEFLTPKLPGVTDFNQLFNNVRPYKSGEQGQSWPLPGLGTTVGDYILCTAGPGYVDDSPEEDAATMSLRAEPTQLLLDSIAKRVTDIDDRMYFKIIRFSDCASVWVNYNTILGGWLIADSIKLETIPKFE